MSGSHEPFVGVAMLLVMILPKQYHWLLVWFDTCVENMPNWVLICVMLCIFCNGVLFSVYSFVVHPCIFQPFACCVKDWKSGNGSVLTINDIGDALGNPGSRLHKLVALMLDDMSQERALASGLLDARTKLHDLDQQLRDAEPRYNANERTMTCLEDRVFNLEQRTKGKLDARLRQEINNVVVQVNSDTIGTAIQRSLGKVAVITRSHSEDQWRDLKEQVSRLEARLDDSSEQEDRVEEALTDMRQCNKQLESSIKSQTDTITILTKHDNEVITANADVLERLSRLENAVVNNQHAQLQNAAATASKVDALEITLESLPTTKGQQEESASTDLAIDDTLLQYTAQLKKQSEHLKEHSDQLMEVVGVRSSVDVLTEQHLEHESQLEQVKHEVEKISRLQKQIEDIKLSRIEQESVSRQIGVVGDRIKTLETANASHDTDRNQIRLIPEIRAKLAGVEFALSHMKATSTETAKAIEDLHSATESTETAIANLEARFKDIETDLDVDYKSIRGLRDTTEEMSSRMQSEAKTLEGLLTHVQECEAKISAVVGFGSIPTKPRASAFGSFLRRSLSDSPSPFAAHATDDQAPVGGSAGATTPNFEHDSADNMMPDMLLSEHSLQQKLVSPVLSATSFGPESGGVGMESAAVYNEEGIPEVDSLEFDDFLLAGEAMDADGEVGDDAYGMCGDGH